MILIIQFLNLITQILTNFFKYYFFKDFIFEYERKILKILIIND